jgi:hypothetical protein
MRSSIDSGKMSCSSSVGPNPSLYSGSPHPEEHPYHIDMREHKLRIVERLGTVNNALQSDVFSQQNSSKIPMTGPVSDNQAGADIIAGTTKVVPTEEQTIREETVVEPIDLTKVIYPPP